MAARKKSAKSSKRFLSRKKVGSGAGSGGHWIHIGEIAGVALIILTIASIISLISHNPGDRSFNAAAPGKVYENYLGWFGAYLSDLLIQVFGFGAFFFPVLSFVAALSCFVRLSRNGFTFLLRSVGGVLFAAAVIGLGTILSPTRDFFFPDARPGGLVGELLTATPGAYLGAIGTFLLYLFLLISSILVITGITIRTASAWLWSTLVLLAQKVRQRYRLSRGRAVKVRSRKEKDPPAKKRAAEPEIVEHPPAPQKRKPPAKKVKQEVLDFRRGDTFKLPPLALLDDPPASTAILSREELIANSRILEKKLRDFGVNGKVTQVHPGPVITMYEFEPAPGIKVNRIVNLADDLALAMSALAVRVVAPIPGKSVVGIEIPNHQREIVHLKDIMLSDEFRAEDSKLAVALGKDIFGTPMSSDLSKMPHVLIAGATGAGKSVMINSMICSILFSASPEEVQFIMIDPKMVELTNYDGIPHLIAPVVSNPKKAAYALRNAVGIMEERYRLLAEKKVRNIESYNKLILKAAKSDGDGEEAARPMSYLVIVIDELADLMILAQNEVEDSITRLAQLSRAVGIHLMIATQRPSTNVITGVIKANLPVRISFQVSSKIDSRVVLDNNGAEQLLGKGDMLFLPPGTNRLERVHGAYLSEVDVNRLVEHLKAQAQPTYDETILKPPPVDEPADTEGEEDEMYDQAVQIVTTQGQASISFLQRKLRVGYNRAARMIEAMEHAGIIGAADGAKPRKVLTRRNYD